MGHREVRRVPLDFDAPLKEVWQGYRMPESLHLPECAACGGEGYSPEARAVAHTFYPHQIGGPYADALAWHDKIGQAEVDYLVEKGRLRVLRRREPTPDNPSEREWASVPRAAAEVNAEQHARTLGGHDAINRMYLIEFRCERLGIDAKCPVCEGRGEVASPELRAAHETWKATEPPTGDGWQLWETTSEGSPVSPVFDTAEALAAWCEDGATVFAGERWTAGQWLETFRAGTTDAASLMVMDGAGFHPLGG